jgi:hypothetical protein
MAAKIADLVLEGPFFSIYVSGQPLEKHLETIKHLQDREKFILPQDRRI